jgi:hypothetical protein
MYISKNVFLIGKLFRNVLYCEWCCRRSRTRQRKLMSQFCSTTEWSERPWFKTIHEFNCSRTANSNPSKCWSLYESTAIVSAFVTCPTLRYADLNQREHVVQPSLLLAYCNLLLVVFSMEMSNRSHRLNVLSIYDFSINSNRIYIDEQKKRLLWVNFWCLSIGTHDEWNVAEKPKCESSCN